MKQEDNAMLKLRDIQRSPEAHVGKITVGGWVRTVRQGKAMGFIELNDGTCFKPIQVVFENDERDLGKGLSVHYSGGSSLHDDVSAWLSGNGISLK